MHALGYHIGSATPPALADLSISGFNLAATTVNFMLKDTGTASAAASVSGLYLSTDSTITTSDTLLGTFAASTLLSGVSRTESVSFSLPTNLAAGTYYLGAMVDVTSKICREQ